MRNEREGGSIVDRQSEERRMIEDAVARVSDGRASFIEKYGEDMYAYSLAFMTRNKDFPGFTELRGEYIQTEGVIDSLGWMIVDHTSAKTVDVRAEKMTEYLKDLLNLI